MYDKEQATDLLQALALVLNEAIQAGTDAPTMAVAIAGLMKGFADTTNNPAEATINGLADLAHALTEDAK